jgi:hypothetical protein
MGKKGKGKKVSNASIRCRPSLQNLPTDLFRLLLSFICLPDLIRLDNSLTNHELREIYLTAMRGFSNHSWRSSTTNIDWIILRGVSLKEISFSEFAFQRLELIEKFRSSLVTINFGDLYLEVDLHLIGTCPSLTHLNLSGNSFSSNAWEPVLISNPQIRHLDLRRASKLSNDIIKTIVAYCPHLEHLDLSFNMWVTDETIALLVSSQLRLKSLQFRCTNVRNNETIVNLLDTFPSLSLLGYDQFAAFETNFRVLTEITFPSVLSEDHGPQILGINEIHQLIVGYLRQQEREEQIQQMVQSFLEALTTRRIISHLLSLLSCDCQVSERGDLIFKLFEKLSILSMEHVQKAIPQLTRFYVENESLASFKINDFLALEFNSAGLIAQVVERWTHKPRIFLNYFISISEFLFSASIDDFRAIFSLLSKTLASPKYLGDPWQLNRFLAALTDIEYNPVNMQIAFETNLFPAILNTIHISAPLSCSISGLLRQIFHDNIFASMIPIELNLLKEFAAILPNRSSRFFHEDIVAYYSCLSRMILRDEINLKVVIKSDLWRTIFQQTPESSTISTIMEMLRHCLEQKYGPFTKYILDCGLVDYLISSIVFIQNMKSNDELENMLRQYMRS